ARSLDSSGQRERARSLDERTTARRDERRGEAPRPHRGDAPRPHRLLRDPADTHVLEPRRRLLLRVPWHAGHDRIDILARAVALRDAAPWRAAQAVAARHELLLHAGVAGLARRPADAVVAEHLVLALLHHGQADEAGVADLDRVHVAALAERAV